MIIKFLFENWSLLLDFCYIILIFYFKITKNFWNLEKNYILKDRFFQKLLCVLFLEKTYLNTIQTFFILISHWTLFWELSISKFLLSKLIIHDGTLPRNVGQIREPFEDYIMKWILERLKKLIFDFKSNIVKSLYWKKRSSSRFCNGYEYLVKCKRVYQMVKDGSKNWSRVSCMYNRHRFGIPMFT